MDTTSPSYALFAMVQSAVSGGIRLDLMTVMLGSIGIVAILIGFDKLKDVLGKIAPLPSASRSKSSGDDYVSYAAKRKNAEKNEHRYEVDEANRNKRTMAANTKNIKASWSDGGNRGYGDPFE